MSSEMLWNLSDSLWGSAAAVLPAGGGSVGDVLFGILTIPSALVFAVSDILWGFGS